MYLLKCMGLYKIITTTAQNLGRSITFTIYALRIAFAPDEVA